MSVGWLVGRSVGRSVRPSVLLSSKSLKNGLLRILNDLDSAGRGKKRDEEGGTRGWRDEVSEKNEKNNRKMKNEEVAKGHIIGLAGPC